MEKLNIKELKRTEEWHRFATWAIEERRSDEEIKGYLSLHGDAMPPDVRVMIDNYRLGLINLDLNI